MSRRRDEAEKKKKRQTSLIYIRCRDPSLEVAPRWRRYAAEWKNYEIALSELMNTKEKYDQLLQERVVRV